jgi:hypothetical protein
MCNTLDSVKPAEKVAAVDIFYNQSISVVYPTYQHYLWIISIYHNIIMFWKESTTCIHPTILIYCPEKRACFLLKCSLLQFPPSTRSVLSCYFPSCNNLAFRYILLKINIEPSNANMQRKIEGN